MSLLFASDNEMRGADLVVNVGLMSPVYNSRGSELNPFGARGHVFTGHPMLFSRRSIQANPSLPGGPTAASAPLLVLAKA